MSPEAFGHGLPAAVSVIAVMAGGESRRMGRDKAALLYGGESWLRRIVGIACSTGRDVVVVGRERPGEWNLEEIEFLPDEHGGLGPLVGIATALRRTGAPVLTVACDLPLISSEAIMWLLEAYEQRREADGLIVMNNGRPEPLFSVYAPSVLATIDSLLERDDLAVRSLLREGQFAVIELPERFRSALTNVNTPDELERFQRAMSEERRLR